MKDKECKIGFLFDLDGVLIDSESEYTRIWNSIDSVFPTGIKNFSIVIKGKTLPDILNTYFHEDNHAAIIGMLNSMEQKMHYEMLPGAEELLRKIKESGYESVLVTSSNNLKMNHLREEQPTLESYFKAIVTADKVTRSKPDPEGYLLGASLLGVPARKCVVFEDSEQGVKAGRSAGCLIVGLTTTLPKEKLLPYSDIIVRDLSEINIKTIIEILCQR